MRGQALIEAALVLPILLFILLGGISIGLIVLDKYELQHAATEGAIVGASSPSERCANAKEAAIRVLGRRPSSIGCVARSRIIELTLAENLPIFIPVLENPFPIRVTGRAAIR
jgi:Flp pilus assembly protein TadG